MAGLTLPGQAKWGFNHKTHDTSISPREVTNKKAGEIKRVEHVLQRIDCKTLCCLREKIISTGLINQYELSASSRCSEKIWSPIKLTVSLT